MKNLKFNSIAFSLLVMVILFMSSCEKDNPVPDVLDENQLGLPSTEFMKQLDETEQTLVPKDLEILELTEEIEGNVSTRADCTLNYGAWNYTVPLGWIIAYNSGTHWFYSQRFEDYIKIYNHDDICDGGGILFQSNHPICSYSGYFYLFDQGGLLYHWNGYSWSHFTCYYCQNNDFSSRFIELIGHNKNLEGAAEPYGVNNYYNDMVKFRNLVQTDGPLDIKNTNNFLIQLREQGCGVRFFGRDVAPDVPGNVLYGFIGYLYWKERYDNQSLFLPAAAGLAQGISDGVIGGPFAAGLLLDPTDWLYLTSYDPWCDTYAILLGIKMASDHGANITVAEFEQGVNSPNTWLNEPSYHCPATSSPTGW